MGRRAIRHWRPRPSSPGFCALRRRKRRRPAHKEGLAHLVEHLMFDGSRHVAPGEFSRLLARAGAVDVNGRTSFDATNWTATFPQGSQGAACHRGRDTRQALRSGPWPREPTGLHGALSRLAPLSSKPDGIRPSTMRRSWEQAMRAEHALVDLPNHQAPYAGCSP
jgi:hypothetical protein